MWRSAHQSSQRLFPDVHVGIDAVSLQSVQRCIHSLEPNEVDFHRLHVLPPDQRAISRTGIEGIALRLQLGRRPVNLNVRLLHVGKEVVQSDSRFAVTLLSGFCQLNGLVELLVAQQITNTRNGFAILGEFFVKLGDFSQRLQSFFSFEQVGQFPFRVECCPSSPLLLVKVEIALQHLPQLFFLDGPEIVVFVGVDERFGEHTEQIVAVDRLTVAPHGKECGVVLSLGPAEQRRLLHRFEQQVVRFSHVGCVVSSPGVACFLCIQASQGVEPQGAFHRPLFFGQFCLDELAHHRTTVRRNLLLHHLFGEEGAEQLGSIARTNGLLANEAQGLYGRLGLIFFGGRIDLLPPLGEILCRHQLYQTRGTE